MTLALFDNIGFGELMLVVIVALLVFGRRLPEVAGQAGGQIARLKRSLEDLRQESGIDKEVRRMQDEIRKARDVIPRNLSIGEMARRASAELEKRVLANEQADAAERDAVDPSAATPGTTTAPAPATPGAEPALRSAAVRADGTPIDPARPSMTSDAPSDGASDAPSDAASARERAYAAGTPSYPVEGGSAPLPRPSSQRPAPILGAPLDEDEPRETPPAAS